MSGTLPEVVRRLLAATLAVLAVAVAVGTSPLPAYAATTCAPDPVLCPARPYFGAAVDDNPRSHQALASFTNAVGRLPSVDSYFQSWADGFDVLGAKEITSAGMLPMVTWEPFDAKRSSVNTFPLRSIAAGTFDTYIAQQAQRMASVGAPVALRFGHEMNGDWYPWGQPRVGVTPVTAAAYGNTPADYVNAYRHVHDVFVANGARNVVWLWAPNLIDGNRALPLVSLYPGDSYVDWVGVSGYYGSSGDMFASRYPSTFAQFDQFAPTKPIFIAETSVLPNSRRVAQIQDLVRGVVATPRVIGFTWFDMNKRERWRIDDDAPAAAALGRELAAGGFSSGARPLQPVLEAPRAVSWTTLEGGAQVGATLRGTAPQWVTTDDGGPISATTTSWWRCDDTVTTTSCTDTGTTGPVLSPTSADLGHVMRYQATATNLAGTTTEWSEPSLRVITAPTVPAAPTVTSRDRSAVVTFPAVPAGATHWRVTVNGAALPLVPTTDATVTLPDLVNGPSYTLQLQAATVDGDRRLFSPEVAGTFAAIAMPRPPEVTVSGTTGTFALPAVPTGSRVWQLTVDGTVQEVALSTGRVAVESLVADQAHTWSLRAVAGTFGVDRFGSMTPPVSGTFTPRPLSTPTLPTVTSRDRSAVVTFPAAPSGATHWRVTVNGVARPRVPIATRTLTLTGLVNGPSYTLGLQAATVTGEVTVLSSEVAGTFAAIPMPLAPKVGVSATTATFTMPASPTGSRAWQLDGRRQGPDGGAEHLPGRRPVVGGRTCPHVVPAGRGRHLHRGPVRFDDPGGERVVHAAADPGSPEVHPGPRIGEDHLPGDAGRRHDLARQARQDDLRPGPGLSAHLHHRATAARCDLGLHRDRRTGIAWCRRPSPARFVLADPRTGSSGPDTMSRVRRRPTGEVPPRQCCLGDRAPGADVGRAGAG